MDFQLCAEMTEYCDCCVSMASPRTGRRLENMCNIIMDTCLIALKRKDQSPCILDVESLRTLALE
jgi:hypothetical protein